MSQYKAEIVLKNIFTSTGEGPCWDERTKSLLMVDVGHNVGGRLLRWNFAAEHLDAYHEKDSYFGFIIPCSTSNGFVVGHDKKIQYFSGWHDIKFTDLTSVDGDKLTRFNDAKCGPNGTLYCGTMGLEKRAAELEMNLGALFSYDGKSDPILIQPDVTISNGLAWSKDSQHMFFIDSLGDTMQEKGKIYHYDFDVNTNAIGERSVLVDCQKNNYPGVPDGMCIDKDDKLWVAFYSGGQLLRFDSETGKDIDKITLPNAPCCTSCCFGGTDYKELFVTCGTLIPPGVTVSTEGQINNGSLFRITGLPSGGLPSAKFTY